MRKKLTLLVVLFVVSAGSLYAQMGMGMRGGMRGGMGGMQGGYPGVQMQQRKIDLVASTGLFFIDFNAVIEDCKIKSEDTKNKIMSALTAYRQDYDNISYEYAAQVDSLQQMTKLMSDENAVATTDVRIQMRSLMSAGQNIRKKTVPMHKELKENMSSILPEKELKRWEKYYDNLCDSYMFRAEAMRPGGGQGNRPEGGSRGQRAGRGNMQGESMEGDMDSDIEMDGGEF